MLLKETFFRNLGTITRTEQQKIHRINAAIVGLGGTGGFAFENLLRLGVQNFTLFDPDRFELWNMNRQLLSSFSILDRPKTEVAEARAKDINKNVKIKKHFRRFGAKDLRLIEKLDFVIDGSDNVTTRVTLASACKKAGVPYVFCSANYSRGIVSIFVGSGFEQAFQISKSNLGKYKTCSSVICPSVAVAGTLAASQAINMALGKSYIKAPEALFFDLFSKELFWKKRLK